MRPVPDGELTDAGTTIQLMDWLEEAGFPKQRGDQLHFRWLHHGGVTFAAHRKFCARAVRGFHFERNNHLTAARLRHLADTVLETTLGGATLDDRDRLRLLLEARSSEPPVDGWGAHVHPAESVEEHNGPVATERPGPPFLPPEGYRRVFEFLGYGSLEAPFWFLGMEEGLNTERLNLAGNLERRAAHFEEVMDLAEAHSSQLLDAPPDPPSPTWRWMAKLMLGLDGGDLDRPAAADQYVRDHLGRAGGQTLLAELLPLPSPTATAWPPEYQAFFSTRREYERAVGPWRRERLRSALLRGSPHLIVAFGRRHDAEFRRLFQDVDFGRQVGLDARFVVGWRDETLVVLSPFLGNGQMSHAALRSLCRFVLAAVHF